MPQETLPSYGETANKPMIEYRPMYWYLRYNLIREITEWWTQPAEIYKLNKATFKRTKVLAM
jgi:hypothetical protein